MEAVHRLCMYQVHGSPLRRSDVVSTHNPQMLSYTAVFSHGDARLEKVLDLSLSTREEDARRER